MKQSLLKNILYVLVIIGLITSVLMFTKYWDKTDQYEGIASGNGRLETTEVDITTKYGGRIANIYAQEGDMVEKGQLLAELDTREIEAQYKVALAGVEQAKQNKNYAQAIVSQQEIDLTQKKKNYLRSKTLFESKSIALITLEEDETEYQRAEAALMAAKAQVTNYEAAINAAKANAESIEVQLQESKLYSPVKGRVLYRLVEEGEMIGNGGKALVVLDLIDTYMTIFLPTSEVGLINIGSEARIVLDALPNIPIPAKVSFISPEAQFTPKEIETETEREKLMFRVKVKIAPELLQGHLHKIKSGLPGVAYVRLNETMPWPDSLTMRDRNESRP
ncbi:efflux RND transporter periplasmic adaptor subunit [Sulfurovum sp. zt1-1]|uniref:Efflux RND transporter periplasmic adaptor subunit n=1 Tax=Sulfurovum zhangzhouensis TaxID=3019067 RepID=A0ABT7QZL3_9BACT|nr:HlyD family efflux transporter periplasmic adaptor subunit [Sulfurovum zhangzhouensis]MDM5272221.1 efflux RND transporter periplasmic adaptor subunit [Sulfurovum zhangzhouensis]